MGFGFDREEEPEILDSDPERPRTWLRGPGSWLSGQNVPAVGRTRSWLRWGRGRLGWVAAVTVAAVLAGGVIALNLSHGRRGAPMIVARLAGPGTVSQRVVIQRNGSRKSLGIMQAPAAASPCNELSSSTSANPYPGYRVEFGDVAVQPAVGPTPPYRNPEGPRGWPYAEQTVVMFSSVSPGAVISVPPGWQKVVNIGTPDGPASALHLPSCGGFGTAWSAFVTVFYLHSPTACVPLRIQVGRHATTVRFGLGRRCG